MILLWLVLIVYLVYTYRIILKICKTINLNKNQKILNIIIVILIPFLWGVFISFIIKPSEKGWIDNEAERENALNGSYHESGVGYPGLRF